MSFVSGRRFIFPLRGVEVSWTPLREQGGRILCRAESGENALFAPEHLRRIYILEASMRCYVASREAQVNCSSDRLSS